MWEFWLENCKTGEVTVIFGCSLKHAFEKSPELNPKEWSCFRHDYID